MIFPGLSGGSGKGYVKALVKTLLNDDFTVVVFHNRGVEMTEYTSPQFAKLSSSLEMETAIEHVQRESGEEADLVGVGLSMGANMMMRVAGE